MKTSRLSWVERAKETRRLFPVALFDHIAYLNAGRFVREISAFYRANGWENAEKMAVYELYQAGIREGKRLERARRSKPTARA